MNVKNICISKAEFDQMVMKSDVIGHFPKKKKKKNSQQIPFHLFQKCGVELNDKEVSW